jgi:parallel beta-helix repeat protein
VYYAHVRARAENAYKLFIDLGSRAQRVLYVNDGSINATSFTRSARVTTQRRPVILDTQTLASLIADQQIGPNDIVLFDTGVYASGTAVLTAADAGAIFAGSPVGSTLAYSGTRIELNDSSNNLFSDLIFAGACGTGIHIRGDGAGDALGNIIEHNQFLGMDTGVRSDSQGSNSIHDNFFVGNGTYAVYIGAQADAIVATTPLRRAPAKPKTPGHGVPNDVPNAPPVSTDSARSRLRQRRPRQRHRHRRQRHDRPFLRPQHRLIESSNTTEFVLPAVPTHRPLQSGVQQFVRHRANGSNSQILANDIHHNATGLTGSDTLGPLDWSLPNDIHDNDIGVATSTGAVARFNRIHANTIGVAVGSNSAVVSNLIYRNTGTLVDDGSGMLSYSGRGVLLSGTQGAMVENNTIYTPAGDGIRLQGSASGNHLRNNIVWTENGYDLYVANDSQQAFASDYNNFFTTAGHSGVVAERLCRCRRLMIESDTIHTDWHDRSRSTLDNLQFVNLAADDYHLADLVSTSIDAGDP